jgi:hypothetical protein
MQSTLYNLPQNLFVENLLFFASTKIFVCLILLLWSVCPFVCLSSHQMSSSTSQSQKRLIASIWFVHLVFSNKLLLIILSFFTRSVQTLTKIKNVCALSFQFFSPKKTHVLPVLPFRCNLYSKPQNALLIFIQLILV